MPSILDPEIQASARQLWDLIMEKAQNPAAASANAKTKEQQISGLISTVFNAVESNFAHEKTNVEAAMWKCQNATSVRSAVLTSIRVDPTTSHAVKTQKTQDINNHFNLFLNELKNIELNALRKPQEKEEFTKQFDVFTKELKDWKSPSSAAAVQPPAQTPSSPTAPREGIQSISPQQLINAKREFTDAVNMRDLIPPSTPAREVLDKRIEELASIIATAQRSASTTDSYASQIREIRMQGNQLVENRVVENNVTAPNQPG